MNTPRTSTGNGKEYASFAEVLNYRASLHPEKLAFTFLKNGEEEEASVTYQELDKRASAVAGNLSTGDFKGERAILWFNPGLEFISAFMGCLYAGVIAVPVYPPRKNKGYEKLLSILSDSGAKIILTSGDLQEEVALFLEACEITDVVVLSLDKVAQSIVSNWSKPEILWNDIAFLQYTSGSTGQPKGVMVSHFNLIHNCQMIEQSFGANEQTVLVSWLPLYHDMGLIGSVVATIYCGGRCIMIPPVAFLQKPLRWLKAISHYGATISGGPNFAYDLCCEKISEEQLSGLDLKKWKVAFNGAEPVRMETLEKFAHTFQSAGFKKNSFLPCYGMAEGTLLISGKKKKPTPGSLKVFLPALSDNKIEVTKKNGTDVTSLVSCGITSGDQKIYCVDPDTKEICSPGRIGEIWVSGQSVGQGYWNKPELSEEFFNARIAGSSEGPFLRTGDLGVLNDGEVYITGRLKDLIIIRGRNYYPPDVEQAVVASSSLLTPNAGAAFSVDIDGQERLVIVQEVSRAAVRNTNFDALIADIRKAVTEKFELQCHTIVLLRPSAILKTSSGKIQRRACKKTFTKGGFDVLFQWSQTNTHLPSSGSPVQHDKERAGSLVRYDLASIRQWLINKVSAQLKVDASFINSNESFDAYGMDSLAAVQIAEELGTWMGRELPPTLVYDYPSIAVLAEFLAGEKNNKEKTNSSSLSNNILNEPIAIIGMGCRFPDAPDVTSFWKLLDGGKDAIRFMPQGRINDNASVDKNIQLGYLDRVDGFDPHFFGISPREANGMDPQQRLLMEVSWEALENAGIAPDDLSGEEAGVFIGISSNDYQRLSNDLNIHSGTNNAFSIAANRLSYFLNFKGPSIAIDTACSSSLVAIHQACQSLRLGECTVALAGGVNIVIGNELNSVFSQAGMIAANSRCKTFDASADGYVRGEGCGIIVLKSLSQAKKDGDTVLALIRGSAINQDGKSNGLTAPNGPSQEKVITKAIQNAGLVPSQISYVETHGSGTSLGDPIEVNALKRVLLEGRSKEETCWIGTVKTNIGHLEAAAGIAGVIKTVLALQHKRIPAHLHFQTLNPHISLSNTPIRIPVENQEWKTAEEKRYAGASSFGFGGTNAHIILEEASEENFGQKPVCYPVHLLTLSARTEEALKELGVGYEKFLLTNSIVALEDICFTSSTGRTHFNHRLAILAASREELLLELDNFRNGQLSDKTVTGKTDAKDVPHIAFLFTGQGAQYVGMGKVLYDSCKEFRDIVDYCSRYLSSYLEKPLMEVLFSEEGEKLIHQTAYTQPALFVLEYALARLWMSWGIKPEALLGHSAGQYVAACIAGVFSLEDGLTLIAERARLMQELPAGGVMAAIFTDAEKVRSTIAPYKDEVTIAAVNGHENVVISGNGKKVEEILRKLNGQNIASKMLEVSHAFHSPLMKPVVEKLKDLLEKISYSSPSIKIISNVSGKVAGEELCTPQYWINHLLAPVLFHQGMNTLEEQNIDCYMEMGPQPTLLAMGKLCVAKAESKLWLPSLRNKQNDIKQMFQTLMQLYARGATIDWKAVYQHSASGKIMLPTYPFQRQRCWIETTTKMTPITTVHESVLHPLLGRKLKAVAGLPDRHVWEIVIKDQNLAYLKDHLAWGTPVMPHTVYVGMALAAAEEALGKNSYKLTNLQLHGALFIPADEIRTVQIVLDSEEESCSFKVFSAVESENPEWTLFASATVYPGKERTLMNQNDNSKTVKAV